MTSWRLLVTLALVASLAAPAARAQPPSRTLRLGLVQQPNSLDPLHATQFYENYLAEALFSALVVIDDRGNVAPDLAETVPTRANGGISADGKTITYRLRKGVRWQDGVPLTSADVAFTLAKMREPATNYPELSAYSIVERLETPDAHTVVLHLRSPWADATSQLFVGGQNGSIVPEHLLKNVPNLGTSSFESNPVGSGPYTLERWERGSRIVLRANPAYFRGKPHIDRIDVTFVPDQNTLSLQMKTGELDFSPQLSVKFAPQLRDTPGLQIRSPLTFSDVELVFNVHAPPVDDPRVRRALVLSVDRARLASSVYHGFAVIGDDLVPPQSPYHRADPALAPAGNPEDARSLLAFAGWKTGADGVRVKNGQRLALTMMVPAGYAEYAACAVQIQAMWRRVGVEANLLPEQSNLLLSPGGPLAKGDFTVVLAGDGYAISPDRADVLTSGGLPPNGRNYSHYVDRDVDAWTAEARKSSDERIRHERYAAISKTVLADAPLVPLLWRRWFYAYSGSLQGVRPETVNSDFWNVYDWYWRS